MRLAQFEARLLSMIFRLVKLAAQRSPIPQGHIHSYGYEIAQVRQRLTLRVSDTDAVQSKGIRLDSVDAISVKRRKESALCGRDAEIRRPERFHRHAQVRVLVLGHSFRFRKRGQGQRRVHIIHDGEILVQSRKQQDGEIHPCRLHGEARVVERLLCLPILNLRLHHVAVRGLADALRILSDGIEMLSRVPSRLRGRILALRNRQRVIQSGDGKCQAPPRDFRLRAGDRFRCSCAAISRAQVIVRRKILMKDSPGAIHVDTVIRDESSDGSSPSISLRQQSLRRITD